MSERLTDQENNVLTALSSNEEHCENYDSLESRTGLKREYLKPIIKHFKELGYIEHWRGLMTEDGEVAGSGWCRSRAGNEYVEEHEL